MTLELLNTQLTSGTIKPEDAYNMMKKSDITKKINYYKNIGNISSEPLNEIQLQELIQIVNICQTLYNSSVDSPIDDLTYDILQELLISDGIPRLSGNIEINDNNKVSGKFTKLRGTLDKVYYLTTDEKRINKSRKYLDEWLDSISLLYYNKTGKRIDMDKVKIMLQPKFDGVSVTLEIDDKMRWITRGDTRNNLASDVTHIMNVFNDDYENYYHTGIKFECMCSEDDKDIINQFYQHHPYRNSRQIVSAVVNSNEADFKIEYMILVPLRIYRKGDKSEVVNPDLIKKFPTKICTFGDRDEIKEFANHNRYVNYNGKRLRTDGVVMTILDEHIKEVLGRENNINNFEVAYKFTEEYAYSKVKGCEFNTSDFGYICPVVVINDLTMKGNNVNHISLSNKERFDELNLSYGDEVKVLYDIIPYVTLDEKCKRIPNGRKIEFIDRCPMCHEKLNLNVTAVQCKNPNCPSRIIGRILNYCQSLRMQYIGYSTIDLLYSAGFLDDGLISLYKLKKKSYQIKNLDGFGEIKTRKIIREIESKRKLTDAEFFGSLGIEGLHIKTFEGIFKKIPLNDFLNLFKLKNWDLLKANLIMVDKIGPEKADKLINHFKDPKNYSFLKKLMKEVNLKQSYSNIVFKGRIVFTGCRPSQEMKDLLKNYSYETGGWSNNAKCIVIPREGYESSTVSNAINHNIPIITIDELTNKLLNLGG